MNGSYIKKAFHVLLLTAMVMFSFVSLSCSAGRPSEKIVSFEMVTLRLSGMRGSVEYEIVMEGKDARVTEYAIRYNKDEVRVPQRRTVCSSEKVLTLLNNCDLISWDGFFGKHPKNVKDGIMFSLDATVNGGRKVKAQGSENFPKHFRELRDGLYAILSSNG